MGKKSRRPNRNKPKDIPAAASTAVASPRQVITSAPDDVAAVDPNQCELMIATFDQMCVSQDWEGLLEHESEMSAIANSRESSNAGSINLVLGAAHQEMGREGGIEEATFYYKKAIELAKKAGNFLILSDGVLNLSELTKQCIITRALVT